MNNTSYKMLTSYIPKNEILFSPVGGVGEIGMNFYLYGTQGKWIIVDLGITFGNTDETPGVDIILPNPEFIKIEELRRTGLGRYFEFALYSSSAPYRKPHPSIFRAAISRLQVNAKDILFVGDNLIMDVEGPQAVGMSAAWLNRNGSSLTNGIVPDYQVTSLSELLQIAPLKV